MRIRSGLLLALLLAAGHLSAEILYSVTDLGTLGGYGSFAEALNNAGQVTGSSITSTGGSQAFLYSNGQMTDLGTLAGGRGVGLNNAGQVTGDFRSTSNGATHAFLYSN